MSSFFLTQKPNVSPLFSLTCRPFYSRYFRDIHIYFFKKQINILTSISLSNMVKRLYRNGLMELIIWFNKQSIHILIWLMKMSMRCQKVEAHYHRDLSFEFLSFLKLFVQKINVMFYSLFKS